MRAIGGEATAQLTNAIATVERLSEERQPYAEASARLADARRSLEEADRRMREAEAAVDTLAAQIGGVAERLRLTEIQADDTRRLCEVHAPPRFWSCLLRGVNPWRAQRAWDREHRPLEEASSAADTRWRRQREEHQQLVVARADADEVSGRARTRYAEVETLVHRLRTTVEAARQRWGNKMVPVDDDGHELHNATPWSDREMVEARTEVLLAALRVHRAFVLEAAAQVRDHLDVVTDLLKGKKITISDDARREAWEVFFTVVPVVSTTFASLPNLFQGLGREALGWLVVDEAGQATPQSLVGGLWRARRALVVGDPQQLEPVLPVLETVMKALRRRAGAHEAWSSVSSAQEVADRVTTFGTTLSTRPDHESSWTGTPLRVHRRCERQIFDAFSSMAYGRGLLSFGTVFDEPFSARESTWVDVPSVTGAGKWSPAEGRALTELLDDLGQHGIDPLTIRVLSPFLDVVDNIRDLPEAAGLRVGTVHTMQGKEADVVIIVLGTGAGHEGARRWATERPNLLNVAVSRARRRLYVIGDITLWGNLSHAHELAGCLKLDQSRRASDS